MIFQAFIMVVLVNLAALTTAVEVTFQNKYSQSCDTDFGNYFWIPRSALPLLGMPLSTCGAACGSVVFGNGSYNLDQINVADGHDACSTCGCDLAFIQLAAQESMPSNYKPGITVSMTYSTKPSPYHPGPPAPPSPPPPSCNSFKTQATCDAVPQHRCVWVHGACTIPPPPPPPPPPPLPPSPCRNITIGGLEISLRCGSRSIVRLGYTDDAQHEPAWWGRNFSFTPPLSNEYPRKSKRDYPGSHWVGDVTLRVQPASCTNRTKWGFYTSASSGALVNATIIPPNQSQPHVFEMQDITEQFLYRPTDNSFGLGLNVTRSWEEAQDSTGGLVLRVVLTNTNSSAIRVGGFGFSLVPDTSWGGLNLTAVAASLSFLDPHIGGGGGWATWARADGSRSLVVTPATQSAVFEAYRPLLEDAGHIQAVSYEWTVHSEAWEAEWAMNKQAPCPGDACSFPTDPAHAAAWPNPKSPWPSWHSNETVNLPNPRQWHPPTSVVLASGETKEYALRFTLADAGPRSVPATLEKIGVAVIRSVPGYVLATNMTAQLLVKPPTSATITSTHAFASDVSVIGVGKPVVRGDRGWFAITMTAKQRGRGSVNVTFSDGSYVTAHYFCIGTSLEQHVANYGKFAAETAWLPADYADPFNRQNSIVPWDREDNRHVLQDGRTFIVGLSDDAGGGNHLGFASKVWHMPTTAEFAKIDTYINSTLLGKSKTCGGECADPYFSLQNPETYKILMTIFYHHYDSDSKVAQQHVYNKEPYYTDLDKCIIGPSWCSFNAFADGKSTASWTPADYRQYNYPHQIASYYAMYLAIRNYNFQGSMGDWDFYLRATFKSMQAMSCYNNTTNTSACVPSVGLMDGTVFREALIAMKNEPTFSKEAALIEDYMRQRAVTGIGGNVGWQDEDAPYGSEFNWDTTGQEEVAIWGAYFNATSSNRAPYQYGELNKRAVDAILAYDPWSATWAYHGSAAGWGDFSNNAKWMIEGGWEREGGHYRAGLNSIPLIERFRAYPDDVYLLEVAMGGMTGILSNIDQDGAASMAYHCYPFIQEHDPYSGDFGLAFFGSALNIGSYVVETDTFGLLCYLCDLQPNSHATDLKITTSRGYTITPQDPYHARLYIASLGLHMFIEVGTFSSANIDMDAMTLTLTFDQVSSDTKFTKRRVFVEDAAGNRRPAHNFIVRGGTLIRGAYELSSTTTSAIIYWSV